MAVLCNVTDSHLTSTVASAPDTGEQISITTWMSGIWSTTAATSKSFVGIYGPSVAAPITAIQIGSRVTNNAVYVWTWGGGVLVNTGAGVVTDGVNHFIVYTFDGTSHRVFVDGVLQGTSTAAQIAGQFNTFYINGYPTGGTNETSTHVVDSVQLFNRTLQPDEILTMYSSRGSRHGISNGLIAYYEFDEGAQGATTSTCFDFTEGVPAPLTWAGTGTTMSYTYVNGEAKLRPVMVN